MIRDNGHQPGSTTTLDRATPTEPNPCKVCGQPATCPPHDRSDLGHHVIGYLPWPRLRGHPSKVYCPDCLRARADRLLAAGHRWRRRQVAERRMSSAGVPERFRAARFKLCDSRTPEKALQDVREWIKRPDGVLFIHGPVGVGKTHLAACAVASWLEGGRWLADRRRVDDRDGARWIGEGALLTNLRAGFNRRDGWSEADLQDLIDAPLLAYDDLLTEPVSDWSGSVVRRIVGGRYDANRPTIITSNVGLQTVAERLDDRTASRIHEAGRVVRIAGEDRRLTRHGK